MVRAPQRDSVLEMAREVFNVPLAIERRSIETLLATPMSTGGSVTPEALFGLFMREEGNLSVRDGVGLVPIRGGLFRWKLGDIRKRFDEAVRREDVRAILLDVDSPGGTVTDTFDLADAIYAARSSKPVWAVVNDAAYSAAYALASSAERVLLTRTAGVGSVGVIAVHLEWSKYDARVGLTYTPIFAGERKNDYSDTEPLNATARELLQAEVDRLRTIFAETVARNRGMSVADVLATEAGVFYGPAGVESRFADGVAVYDEAFNALREAAQNRAAAAAPSWENEMSDETRQTTGLTTPGSGDAPAATTTAPGTNAAAPSTPPSSAAPPAATPPAAGGDVVSIDAARSEGAAAGAQAERDRVAAITRNCQLAGCPERIGEFVASDMTADQVGAKLLDEQADDAGTEVSGHTPGSTGASPPVIDRDAIYKRRAKEAVGG